MRVLFVPAEVKKCLREKLSSQNSAFTLAHVAALERKLTKHFQVKDFLSLNQGSFLDFLVKHVQVRGPASLRCLVQMDSSCVTSPPACVQLLQDTLGSALILGGGGTMEPAGSCFRPSRQDVFEFIRQCGGTSSGPDDVSRRSRSVSLQQRSSSSTLSVSQLCHVDSALRVHYKVRDSRDFGFGVLQSLARVVRMQQDLAGGGPSHVYYEAALFAKHAVLR